jgi:16S rRNA pseudouridine516 synthase
MKTRIKQFLSKTGRFNSMEEIISGIKNGKVKINNKEVTNQNYFLEPKMDKVTYNDEILRKARRIYYILNKPKGYLSSKLSENDKKLGKKSAFELFNNLKLSESEKNSLFLIGRLDEDTEGLMIATNDGELSNKITSPKSQIEKEYECVLEKELTEKDKEELQKGINIKMEENGEFFEYAAKPAKIILAEKNMANIVIHEGKKREIKRMFEALTNKVLNLKRIRIGNIRLGDLKPKEFKKINKENIY